MARNVIDREIKLLVENEFLFCLRSLDAFNKTKYMSSASAKRVLVESKRISSFISKNDHLYRILKYIIQLFESMQTSAAFANAHGTTARITSWSIYTCLLNMKFDVNDKIDINSNLNIQTLNFIQNKFNSLRLKKKGHKTYHIDFFYDKFTSTSFITQLFKLFSISFNSK